MIEDIKKDIKKHIKHLEKIDGQNIPLKDNFEFCSMNELYQTGKYSAFKDVLEILDKYNNQEKKKYKLFITIYDITKNDFVIQETIIKTHDIYHDIGYIYCNKIEEIKRIDYKELKDYKKEVNKDE